MYPGDVTILDGVVRWVVAKRDTQEEGSGSARIDLVDDNGTVVASAECRTRIGKTHQSGIAPGQVENWTDAASVALSDVRAALLDMEELAAAMAENAQLVKFEIDRSGILWMYYTEGFPYRFAIEEGELIVYAN